MTDDKKTKLNRLSHKLQSIKAGDIMTKDVITTRENTTLAEAAQIMIKSRISGMPVMGKKGKVAGVITTIDLFIVIDMIQSGDVVEDGIIGRFNPTVKFAMSTDYVSVEKDTTLSNIISAMKYKNAHTIPVFEGGKMIGVIGRRDVFKSFYVAVKDLN
jgi:CBS-domain-containing membrane protein